MALCKALLVLLAGLACVAQATPPDITFLCDEMPQVCTNMCWAVRCAQPPFPQRLTLDFASPGRQSNRTVSAGCGADSMCGRHGANRTGHRGPPYDACNLYPFSATSESVYPRGHQVSRCVPEDEQCKQQAQLGLLSKKYQQEGVPPGGVHKLLINFGNPGRVKYCNNDPCVNDGFEVQDGTLKRRSEEPLFEYYRTRSGMILASIDELDTPSNFTRRVGSNERVPASFETWFEEALGERLHMMGDTVLERVPARHLRGLE